MAILLIYDTQDEYEWIRNVLDSGVLNFNPHVLESLKKEGKPTGYNVFYRQRQESLYRDALMKYANTYYSSRENRKEE